MKDIKKMRKDGRAADQLRPISIINNYYEYAAGSVLLHMGKTKVLCAVSLQNGVPQFLRGKGTGWLTAEYALLPMSTDVRTQRESSSFKRDGRAVEIARFIGRCIRSVVDLSVFGEKTIVLDCDVLQADGGTRTAAITGLFCALLMAQKKWLETGVISRPFIKEHIVAVSVGIVKNQVLLDLNYPEDSVATADFNFVMTSSDKIIEMQGGAEMQPIEWSEFEAIRDVARLGIKQLFASCYEQLGLTAVDKKISENELMSGAAPSLSNNQKAPLFSLQSRQNSSR